MAFVVSVIAAVIAASLIQSAVKRTVPVGSAHATDIALRVIEMIEIDVLVIQVINHVCISIEYGAALAT